MPQVGTTFGYLRDLRFSGTFFGSFFKAKWAPKGIMFGSKIDKNGVQTRTFQGTEKKTRKSDDFRGGRPLQSVVYTGRIGDFSLFRWVSI